MAKANPNKLITYELLPKYAEEPYQYIIAATRDEAEEIAAAMAKRGQVSAGYLPGGSLCPVPTNRPF